VTLAAIPGLLLLLVNALWCSTLLGMLSARFRDLPQIVASILQIAFFATPVIWRVNLINNKLLVDLNPFYHFIELVRAPLLGQSATLVSWLVVAGITIFGSVGTFLFYRSHRTRIAFWI
jgi:ABC-type polysaccharide/polyol phosphate export permease